MEAAIAAIYRYPVKGLSAEALDRAPLSIGQCLPDDRRFAIALGTTEFDPDRPGWLPKTDFIMLMRDAALARLHTGFDAETGVLTVTEAGRTRLQASLRDPQGQREIARFFEGFLGGAVPGPLRVVEARNHTFADASPKANASTDKYVSLINLNSVRDLERRIGVAVDPIRFRANVHFDGLPPWCELDWIDRELVVRSAGTDARLRVIAPITRCPATEVNPLTAERDISVVAELMRHFGHNILGIYAEVVEAGDLAVGGTLRGMP